MSRDRPGAGDLAAIGASGHHGHRLRLRRRLDVEYEYLYVNGELDVDAIYSKQKRKRIASYDMAELEILAPSTSHALDSYLNQQGAKVRDFTSRDPQAQSYTLVFSKEGKRDIIKVELNDTILGDIRRIAPRKVNAF